MYTRVDFVIPYDVMQAKSGRPLSPSFDSRTPLRKKGCSSCATTTRTRGTTCALPRWPTVCWTTRGRCACSTHHIFAEWFTYCFLYFHVIPSLNSSECTCLFFVLVANNTEGTGTRWRIAGRVSRRGNALARRNSSLAHRVVSAFHVLSFRSLLSFPRSCQRIVRCVSSAGSLS